MFTRVKSAPIVLRLMLSVTVASCIFWAVPNSATNVAVPFNVTLFPTGQVPNEKPGTFPPERYENDHYYDVSDPTITVHMAPKGNGTYVVVAPGGGYSDLAYAKEGADMATWLNSLNVHAVVLKYRCPARPDVDGLPYGWWALQDAQRAMGIVREKSASWGQNASKVGFIGFSAGGHLSAHIATAWQTRLYKSGGDAGNNGRWVREFTKGLIDSTTPPAFLAQAQDDPAANCENSLFYFLGLKRAKCTVDYSEPWQEVCTWPERAAMWMSVNGLL